MLLAGQPPFAGDTDREIMKNVQSQPLRFTPARLWAHISPDAKDLVKKLLDRDPARRITAGEALLHPWMQTARTRDVGPRSSELDGAVLSSLTKFCQATAFKRTAQQVRSRESVFYFVFDVPFHCIIACESYSQFDSLPLASMTRGSRSKVIAFHMTSTEIGELRHAFERIDEDSTGLVNWDEFISCVRSSLPAEEGERHAEVSTVVLLAVSPSASLITPIHSLQLTHPLH